MFFNNLSLTGKARLVICLSIGIILVPWISATICQAAHWDESNDAIEGVLIGKIRIDIMVPQEKDREQWKKLAQSLICLKEGEPFSNACFSQSLHLLNKSGLFKSIDIPDPDWTDSPMEMIFRLEPFPRIKNIRFSGGFPLLEQEILNKMTLYTGDAYIPEKIEEQAQHIKELFKSEGYIDPDVTFTAEKDAKDGHYILHVTIDKGFYCGITRVRTQGNQHFSSKRLLIPLNTWQSSMLLGSATRLTDEKLRMDRKKLQEFYWQKKFCDARVEADVRHSEDNTGAQIIFTIDEGPRYNVTITGNKAFWTRTLEKEMVIYEDGNLNDFGLRKSIRNIENRYRNAGYLDVRIGRKDGLYEEKGRQVRKITLSIDEGPRYLVENISIEGNKNISFDKMKKQILTTPPGIFYAGQFVPRTLDEDIAAIRSLYKQKGYLSPQIDSNIETRTAQDKNIKLVDITVIINEGPQTVISDIQIENLGVLDEKEARNLLFVAPGDIYREHRVQESRNALAAKISEKGYPHVRIDAQSIISPDGTVSELIFRVDEGPYVEMGDTFFTGNFLTRRKTLSRQNKLKKGEPFSLAEMLESQRNIRNINALETARFKTLGLEEKADRVTLLTEVSEKKPYFFQFATGYDTSRLLYFNTSAGTINLLGRNKELRAFAELSMIGYKTEIRYTEPNLFNIGIVADATVFTEETEELNKDFGVRSTGASINFSRPLTSTISAGLGFLYDYRDQYRLDDTPVLPEDEDQYRSRSILVTTPGLVYNTTDSFVRPTRGIRASASVGISKGIDNDLDDFLKYRLTTSYYYTPAKRLTLALMGQGGYIDPYGSQDLIPEDQLFFLGGTMNVRGFSENRLRVDENRDPVGGRTSLMGSIEARYDLGRNFELTTFYDTGTIRDTPRDDARDEWRESIGLGLRYHTAIGPIGLMYGWKLDREDGESPGMFHFSIGYTF